MLTVKLPQLLSVHQMPRVFWEDGIMSGYRHPKSSALDCLLSSFQMTNETVNIWTHFLPTCLAHTFSSMSTHARHICYFLDYGALSLYSLGCAFTYGAYVMPDRWVNSTLHRYFVPVAAFNTFICTGLSCYSRFLEVERPWLSKILRTVAFVHPFLFDNIPLIYRLAFCFGDDCSWNEAGRLHLYHLLFALLTGFLFASHLPERLAPGRFDYIGHSHQLFHICAVLGTHFQMEAVLCDRSLRKAWLSTHTQGDSLSNTVAVVVTSVAGNILLICFFTATLLWSPHANSILQSHIPGDTKVKEH
ncbi:membrane progestin receptor delta isoform X2 [Ascaphus truei]|uniref:membrane progestin receptor delta isoform X2 n=1 Tax=Ascaphus truei TaxID=8439 RepID=UPI003F5A5B25